jgi:membrane-bound ClpP family serine protease
MYWISVITAVCGALSIVLEIRKGRYLLAGMWGCFAAYFAFSKIFPTVLPTWLVFALSVTGAVLLVIERTMRRKNDLSR